MTFELREPHEVFPTDEFSGVSYVHLGRVGLEDSSPENCQPIVYEMALPSAIASLKSGYYLSKSHGKERLIIQTDIVPAEAGFTIQDLNRIKKVWNQPKTDNVDDDSPLTRYRLEVLDYSDGEDILCFTPQNGTPSDILRSSEYWAFVRQSDGVLTIVNNGITTATPGRNGRSCVVAPETPSGSKLEEEIQNHTRLIIEIVSRLSQTENIPTPTEDSPTVYLGRASVADAVRQSLQRVRANAKSYEENYLQYYSQAQNGMRRIGDTTVTNNNNPIPAAENTTTDLSTTDLNDNSVDSEPEPVSPTEPHPITDDFHTTRSLRDLFKLSTLEEQPVQQPSKDSGIPTLKSDEATDTQVRITLDDLFYPESLRTSIDAILAPYKYPDLAAKEGIKPTRGLLLYGPPGTGKTELARAIAHELGANFYISRYSDIYNMFLSNSPKKMRELMEFAATYDEGFLVLLLDEFDSMIKQVPNDRALGADNETNAVAGEFKSRLEDVFGRNPNVLIIGTTNFPDTIDPALIRPGRFDRKLYIPETDDTSRRALLAKLLAPRIAGEALYSHAEREHFGIKGYSVADDIDIGEIARECDGMSPTSIIEVMRRAQEMAFHQHSKSGKRPTISQEDIIAAILDLRSDGTQV